jgi:hypothetical protein
VCCRGTGTTDLPLLLNDFSQNIQGRATLVGQIAHWMYEEPAYLQGFGGRGEQRQARSDTCRFFSVQAGG